MNDLIEVIQQNINNQIENKLNNYINPELISKLNIDDIFDYDKNLINE
jgi:hypothetical protein